MPTKIEQAAGDAICKKHGMEQFGGYSIKKIRRIGGDRYEVTYTAGADAALEALFAEATGRRDRTPRQKLVFTVAK